MAPRVILITGASSGFGEAMVRKFLKEGDSVVATARNSSRLHFEQATEQNFLALDCDVTCTDSVNAAFNKAINRFDRIDVVFNNAGGGLGGDFESFSNRQIRDLMDVNFFGVLDVTRAALRVMRDHNKPQGGKIIQVSSIWGQTGVPLVSIYCASKWAVEGFTDALREELKPEWNISLTCIQPGGFRTKWASSGFVFGEEKSTAYDHLDAEKFIKSIDGKQPGDVEKGAKVFYDIANMMPPPPRVAVGSDAWRDIMSKIHEYSELYPKQKELANSTDVVE